MTWRIRSGCLPYEGGTIVEVRQRREPHGGCSRRKHYEGGTDRFPNCSSASHTRRASPGADTAFWRGTHGREKVAIVPPTGVVRMGSLSVCDAGMAR